MNKNDPLFLSIKNQWDCAPLPFFREGKIVEPIAIGLSGGADSMFLLHFLLWLYSYHCNFSNSPPQMEKDNSETKSPLFHNLFVLHAQHNLRDDTKEVKLVQEICAANGLQYVIQPLQVQEKRQSSESIEMAARRLRYDFFFKIMNDKQIKTIALGHHSQDLLESIIMRIGEGTGISGLIAMHSYQAPLWRPLLSISKQQILTWLVDNNISWIEDPSNQSPDYLRNRLRPVISELYYIFPRMPENLFHLHQLLEEKKLYNLNKKIEWLKKHSINNLWPESEPRQFLYDKNSNTPWIIIPLEFLLAEYQKMPENQAESFLMEIFHYIISSMQKYPPNRGSYQHWQRQWNRLLRFWPHSLRSNAATDYQEKIIKYLNSIISNNKLLEKNIIKKHLLWQSKECRLRVIKTHLEKDNLKQKSSKTLTLNNLSNWFLYADQPSITTTDLPDITWCVNLESEPIQFLNKLDCENQVNQDSSFIKDFPWNIKIITLRITPADSPLVKNKTNWQLVSLGKLPKDIVFSEKITPQIEKRSLHQMVKKKMPREWRDVTPILLFQGKVVAILFEIFPQCNIPNRFSPEISEKLGIYVESIIME